MSRVNLVKEVEKGSLAESVGVEIGDAILSINHQEVKDVLDYRFLISDEYICLTIKKPSGEVVETEIEKDMYEDLGLVFEKPLIDAPKSCRNKCVFCFMDQLPKGMRKTLHFKDDDYRLSFLEGNYITLSNVSDEELDRIIFYRLSPVNVSVHTTNGELRKKMLNNNKADRIMMQLKKLADAGLEINCQIVLCRGLNDQKELDRTIEDLARLWPSLKSISVVPVGLTKYREGLYPLEGFDKKASMQVVEQINNYQRRFKKDFKTRLVFAADEFYINAEIELPDKKHYESFYQLENGVGTLCLFEWEFNKAMKRTKYDLLKNRVVSVVSGVSASKYISKMAKQMEEKFSKLKVNVYPIENNFFGHKITVAGLVTGQDIIAQLKNKEFGDELLIPAIMLKDDQDIFLDDIRLEDIERELNVGVRKVRNDGGEFVKAILG